MSNEVKCPGCAAEVRFRISSSLVMVCPYCQTVIGRSERGIETWGKFADVVTSESSLELGAGGVYQGKHFHLTGHLQLKHAAGGTWDEWYAYFSDGHGHGDDDRWGWLAEGQGRFYMTFRSGTAEHVIPPFKPGFQVVLDAPYTVVEYGKASIARGEGEIPFAFRPNDPVEYADLSGKDGRFATIDYTEKPPPLFLGRQVTLADLGMSGRPAGRKNRTAGKAVKLTCPECDGALELRAPDSTLRVGCPFCGMLSDVKDGKLSRLQSLKNEAFPPSIVLGTVGTLQGVEWTVLGFMRRSVRSGGVTYPWSEYLLHAPDSGFRWLVESNGHWSFVEPIAMGDVEGGAQTNSRSVGYKGRTFKLFQDDTARVDYVVGEFYWKVEAGEKARAADFVSPPLMLSRETTGDEVAFSLGTYLDASEVKEAFARGIGKSFPTRSGIAPNQPYPHGAMYWVGAVLLALGVLAGGQSCSHARSHNHVVMSQGFSLEPLDGTDKTRVVFSEPFEMTGGDNIRITLESPIDNAWVYVEGDLVNEETGLDVPFSAPIEYYRGVEDGEGWTEGSQAKKIFLSSVPRGRYALRLEAQWSGWQNGQTLTARVEEAVFRPRWLLVLLGLLVGPPILVGLHQYFFEKRRWSESNYSPYESGDSGGGGDDDE